MAGNKEFTHIAGFLDRIIHIINIERGIVLFVGFYYDNNNLCIHYIVELDLNGCMSIICRKLIMLYSLYNTYTQREVVELFANEIILNEFHSVYH